MMLAELAVREAAQNCLLTLTVSDRDIVIFKFYLTVSWKHKPATRCFTMVSFTASRRNNFVLS